MRNLTTQALLPTVCMLVFAFLSLPPALPAQAADMSSEDYSVDAGDVSTPLDISILELDKKASNPKATEQKTTKVQGQNFSYERGFTPETESAPISFSLSHYLIDLGLISATNPVIRTNTLTINSPAGYQILASEDHPLETTNGTVIPDTTCDNGSCSEMTAAPWENALTYGFGYRCDGQDCDKSFSSSEYFKQFANETNREKLQAVMKSPLFIGKRQAKITYKVIISGTQLPGLYTNTVTYLAVPDY